MDDGQRDGKWTVDGNSTVGDDVTAPRRRETARDGSSTARDGASVAAMDDGQRDGKWTVMDGATATRRQGTTRW